MIILEMKIHLNHAKLARAKREKIEAQCAKYENEMKQRIKRKRYRGAQARLQWSVLSAVPVVMDATLAPKTPNTVRPRAWSESETLRSSSEEGWTKPISEIDLKSSLK